MDELRFRYHVSEDRREAARHEVEAEVFGMAMTCGIQRDAVTLDPIIEPTDHARAPEIATQSDPVDMLKTWAEQDGRLDRVTPQIEEKVREIADDLGFNHGLGGDNGSALLEHTRLRVHGIGRLRDVDLTIPEGVTAITGPNGHGKSTILRAFLWAMHRKAPHGKDTDPLSKWAVTKDAHLVLDSHNGVPITASHTLNGERRHVAQSAVLTVDGKILNASGLVKEFDPAAEDVFPNYELYLASAFAEQEGAGAFHSASVAERKVVFRKAL
ncbi:MAG: AAA family ATPase, partial [Deltaproteobacteria bacterium]|nr:AAA family ATPase [Deltaproteobacteria bacterium]